MADRRVTKTRKDSDGDITALCADAWWSPASASEAIKDIENGKHRYFVKTGTQEADIHVVQGPTRKYLRTDPDKTSVDNLDELPDCQMVEITAIHMVEGQSHEHIASVKWTNPTSGATGETSREGMVTFIRDEQGKAHVTDGTNKVWVWVGVVNANPPYIRTYADKVWTDNLLALPRY